MPIIVDSETGVAAADGSMTFLALAQRLLQEGGGTSSTITSVTGQAGDLKRVVNWVADSWVEIQNAKRGWRWLWEDITIPIASGTRTLSLAAIGALVPGFQTRHSHWKPGGFKYYVTSEGVASERRLHHALFERAYEAEYGSTPTAVRPSSIHVTPDGGLRLSHETTAAGVLTATRYKTPQVLSADSDTPEMPSRFHMLVVWHALSDHGVFEAASEIYERSVLKKDKLFAELMVDQLEPVENYATTLG